MRPIIYLFVCCSLLLVSCVDVPNFDDTPRIAFNNIDKFEVFDSFSQTNSDSVVITIDFEDGDGDLGLSPAERSDTNLINAIYRDWGNYEYTTLRLVNGRFEELPSSVSGKLFFPVLKRDGKAGPIKGKLDFSVIYFQDRFTRPATVKYRVRIRDRALRVSNVIETDTITVSLAQ
ncbi:hypothetical protein GCM10027275_22580 [Rhabdobacter roseus]|uniref:Uncharacterized protein n=1 Tax=Rhabdobacter roseus TaxID=1655419 RepID=A0A840TMN2_9BACT|nr:hypothetical protein [Rhabdobacter roseus]MBB5284195.1 hypothetical protein [Rhabdobacter roseus]